MDETQALRARVQAVRKVELHQHVDGSIPPEVTWELMRRNRLDPVDTFEDMRKRLEIQDGEEGSLLAYLDKMHFPLWITQFYENISRVTEAIVDAAAGHGVTTLELRYSPVIHTFAGLTLRQSIRAVLSGMNRAASRHPIRLGLVYRYIQKPRCSRILGHYIFRRFRKFHPQQTKRGIACWLRWC